MHSDALTEAQNLGPDWLDAMLEPTKEQINEAKKLGYYAVGFYIGGHGVDPAHVWSQDGIDIVRNAGLIPIPIYVPSPNLPTDPVIAAEEAYNLAKSAGCAPLVSVLYNGNHQQPTTGPVWLPIPGPKPNAIGPFSAIQWGQTQIKGWTVDISSAAHNFPYNSALVVDFEYNTNYNPSWYSSFQNTISNLSKKVPVMPNSNFTVDDIVAAVMLAMRQQFAGGELWGRIIQACNESIQQNGIKITQLANDFAPGGQFFNNIVEACTESILKNGLTGNAPPPVSSGPNPS